jgi:hypothetical protein
MMACHLVCSDLQPGFSCDHVVKDELVISPKAELILDTNRLMAIAPITLLPFLKKNRIYMIGEIDNIFFYLPKF